MSNDPVIGLSKRIRTQETMETMLVGNGSPDGTVSAAEGTLYYDYASDDRDIWVNIDGDTYWYIIGGSSVQSRMDDCLRWPYRGVAGQTGQRILAVEAAGLASNWDWSNGYSTWTGIGITGTDCFVTAQGGPYLNLDGTEALYIGDGPAQHSDVLMGWQWANFQSPGLANNQVIISKYDTNANRSYLLFKTNAAPGQWRFNVSNNGVAVVASNSSVTPTTGWHFFGYFFYAGNNQRIYVAPASADTLTVDDIGGAAAAAMFNGTANLTLGCYWNAAASINFLPGYIGIGGQWRYTTTATASIDAWMHWLFRWTKPFYGG